jgi:hypothetical protein
VTAIAAKKDRCFEGHRAPFVPMKHDGVIYIRPPLS